MTLMKLPHLPWIGEFEEIETNRREDEKENRKTGKESALIMKSTFRTNHTLLKVVFAVISSHTYTSRTHLEYYRGSFEIRFCSTPSLVTLSSVPTAFYPSQSLKRTITQSSSTNPNDTMNPPLFIFKLSQCSKRSLWNWILFHVHFHQSKRFYAFEMRSRSTKLGGYDGHTHLLTEGNEEGEKVFRKMLGSLLRRSLGQPRHLVRAISSLNSISSHPELNCRWGSRSRLY